MAEINIGKPLGIFERFEKWAVSHLSLLLLSLGIVLGFGALLLGFHFWSQSKESKAQALLYQISKEKGDFEEVVKQFPKTSASLLALVQLARDEMLSKNYDASMAHYEKIYTQARKEAFFRVLALHGIGTCLRLKGEFEKSAQTFERAAKESGHVDPQLSHLEALISLEWAKDPMIKEKYQERLKSNLNPLLKERVEERYLWLSINK